MTRKLTKKIKIGSRFIGGGEPILVQSMTCTPTTDFEATLAQIRSLEEAGCDVVRFTVPDHEAVRNIARLKENTTIPLVADIHFDYRLAIESAQAGVDKIRINPGNIGEKANVLAVASVCREKKIPIRVGVNSGSLERELLMKYGGPTPEALCESALDKVRMLEECDFDQIVVSVKSSNVSNMIATNRLLSERTDYPLHLGVTEAGTLMSGIVKSSIGIGSLLADGIGDTIRVSLTTRDLTEEVFAARRILSSLSLMENTIDIVSCPTCGRTKIDLVGIATELENRIASLGFKPKKSIKVAVMGCIVNGPGEAKDADVGIAGGRSEAILFRKGEIVRKIPEDRVIDILLDEIKKLSEVDL
ncbi:MAG: flavodoxin-dependent (E)-4-hydroxy-3-methylbut-2-enyl-diphosphate synthase [Ruminococcaceae bacterium]|nr:flavodoxin-dependent (E)-4-hydroxy-3-methylbut-2-enyl-diphosphate synthase [Oscillospiraceae bacterium]